MGEMNLPGNDSIIWKDKNLYEAVERMELIVLCSYSNKEQVVFLISSIMTFYLQGLLGFTNVVLRSLFYLIQDTGLVILIFIG